MVSFCVAVFPGEINNPQRRRELMSDQQHCPGFESNKSLSEVKIKCPECGAEFDIFSDEADKSVKCSACGANVDAKACQCSK